MGPTARRESQSTAPAPSLPVEAVPRPVYLYSTIQLPESDTGTRPHYCQKMMYSISVLFEDWPTNAAGQRPRWNSEIGKLCVSQIFCPVGPGCMEKAVGRLKK